MFIPERNRKLAHSLVAASLASLLVGGASAQIRRRPIVAPPVVAKPAIVPAITPQLPAVQFTATVQPFVGQIPVYKLAVTPAPTEFFNEKLKLISAPVLVNGQTHLLSTVPLAPGAAAVQTTPNPPLVRAFVDKATNDGQIVPDLARLVTVSRTVPAIDPIKAKTIAQTAFSDARFIPKDPTTLVVSEKIDVMGGSAAPTPGNATASTAGEPTAVRFSLVPAVRMANGLPVYGQGSHAAITLGNDGSIEGVTRNWKTATTAGMIKPTLDSKGVLTEIARQLNGFRNANSTVTVTSIKNSYYDGGATSSYLQPVYCFSVTIHPNQPGGAADQHVMGYVGAGQTFEPLPDLSTSPGTRLPDVPKEDHTSLMASLFPSPPPPASAITVGAYLNRDNTMLGMGWDFWSGLSLKLPFITPSTPFALNQWYQAQPFEVDGSLAQWYLNSVNVAYTQPHGNWWLSTTLSNNQAAWTVQGITPGFGSATGGHLCTWIIDSCEVVPSMYDTQIAQNNPYGAFGPWWGVFKGLHNVIGFRTEMWLNDGMNFGYGFALSLGADVNGAWFQAIASCPAYNDGQTYLDPHINKMVHYGRASTIIDGRNLGQSIYNVSAQSPSTSLWNFWMNN